MDNRTRWLALYVLCLATLMIVLDVTIVNVALPSIRNGLAVLASVAASRTDSLTASGTSHLSALVGGYHLAFMIGATFAVVAAAVGYAFLHVDSPPHAPDAEPAEAWQ